MPDPAHPDPAFGWPRNLDLRAGDRVEVRSREEILSTLDAAGTLDGLPFMPEMLAYCGRRLEVDSRAVIACDVLASRGRLLEDTVFLRDVRCDGAAHGGCQARCLIYWREAWLKPVEAGRAEPDDGGLPSSGGGTPGSDGGPPRSGGEPRSTPGTETGSETSPGPDEQRLRQLTTRPRLVGATLYRCQATELHRFSESRHRLDPRPLWRVLRSGNETLGSMLTVLSWGFADKLRRRLGLRPRPRIEGKCVDKTPSARLEGLRAGDWVAIKSQEEIEATLDRNQRNRGLWFDVEMLPYCGRTMRLLARADRIIEEHTGAMLELPNDCWIIEGAVCSSYVSHGRLFCTRKIHSFWREIWLRRTTPPSATPDPESDQPSTA